MINNLNIIKNIADSNSYPGLNNIDLDGLQKITNNYVQHIDCICLDEFLLKDRYEVFATIYSKLSLGGTVSLKFINLNLLSNKIDRLEITGEKLSSVLPSMNSVWSEPEYLDLIEKFKLKLNNIYYDYIYTIITLEKNT
jgi:hypothetical protein